jgi:hypothetical protein
MKYISRYNEHILNKDMGDDHILSKISHLELEDLNPGEIYKMSKSVKTKRGNINVYLNLKYIKYDFLEKNHVFYVSGSLTPNSYKILGVEKGDILLFTDSEVLEYISL